MNNQEDYDYREDYQSKPWGTKEYPSSNPQPATPRMLRSVSGSLRGSRNDVSTPADTSMASPTPRQHDEFPLYVASNAYKSHSRNPSFQQQPPPQSQPHQPQSFDPLQVHTPQSSMHRRQPPSNIPTPTSNRVPSNPPPTMPSSFNPKIINQHQTASASMNANDATKNELLPPASIATPPPINPQAESTINSKTNQSVAQSQSHARMANNDQGSSSHGPQQQQQQQPFHRKSIGDWNFIKTIGAGSMGKVKLAQHNTTGEICAVKIVPRAAKLYQRAHADDPPPQTPQEAAQRQKELDKEIARDKRTTREGALGRLLFHPYICRLYEIVPMTNHYYMLFEYVEGGQMLDYIVAHGSLKEKHARKFARGIASALDYCHRNNVVHRDLKIENILINQKGDIKIIDFGLSNLYSPKTLLKTYCGSLYFAAPELLCAKPYIGPEVDVWSFGVVLYVLVCGKVPFDDQSVSVLHEKIKKANVEYPSFLSKECVSLLSRMLQVDPTKRASLYEVINHPWMNKGYEFVIPTNIPKRIPLKLPLDPEVIKGIASFDLGNIKYLNDEITSIVGSVEYHMSSENWFKITEDGREYGSASNSHLLPDPTGGFHPLLSIYYLVDEMKRRKRAKEDLIKAQMEQIEQRKDQGPQRSTTETSVPQTDSPIASQAAFAPPPSQPQPQPQPQLVSPPRQGPSQPFVQGHSGSGQQFPPQHVSSPAPPRQQVPQPPVQPVTPSKQIQTPQISTENPPPAISFPEQAHTSPSTHKPQASNINTSFDQHIPEQQPQSPRDPHNESLDPNHSKQSGINSIFRKLSTKRSKNQFSDKTTSPSNELIVKSSSPEQEDNLSVKKDPMVRRGVSMKVTAKEKLASKDSRINVAEKSQKPAKETRKLHSRSSSINANNGVNKNHGFVPVEYLPPLPNIDAETNQIVPQKHQAAASTSASGRKLHPTARSNSVGGHIRRDSQGNRYRANTQAQPQHLPNQLASQNSDEMVGNTNGNLEEYDGYLDDILLDDCEVQEVPQLSEDEIIYQFQHAKPNTMLSIEYPKTLFLKGFFSVQTTSTKPLPVIRYNIIKVLSMLGVKFQEVKGGFICIHTPSLQTKDTDGDSGNSTMIDSNEEDKVENADEEKLYGDAFKSNSSSIDQNVINRVKTPDQSDDYYQSSKVPSRQPSLHLNTQNLSTPKTHKHSKSISSVGSGGSHRRKFSLGNSLLGSYRKKNGSQSQLAMPPNTPAAARINKLLYGGEFDDDFDENELHEFTEDDSVDSVGNLMVGGGSDMLISSRVEHKSKSGSKTKRSPLNFEIHVVKFPLVGLYGVQFKKLLGNTWNYKTLAGQILNELKL